MTTLEALKSVNSYPIPLRTLEEVAQRRKIAIDDDCTITVIQSNGYNLAYADLLMWLSYAPQITQGGQSYSFTDEQRLQFRKRASELYAEYADEETDAPKARYGYKGSRL